MKSIRTTRRFEGVYKQAYLCYDINKLQFIKKALKSYKREPYSYDIIKTKGSGKVTDLKTIKTDLKSKELQAVVETFWLGQLKLTRRRKPVPLTIDTSDEDLFLKSFLLFDNEIEDDELNLLNRYEYIKGE